MDVSVIDRLPSRLTFIHADIKTIRIMFFFKQTPDLCDQSPDIVQFVGWEVMQNRRVAFRNDERMAF